MKLILEAIRDIMLYVEQNLQLSNNGSGSYESNTITQLNLASELTPSKHYSKEDVIYNVRLLVEHNLLKAVIAKGKNGIWIHCEIQDITWEGHEFLNTIRSDTVWEKTKERAQKIGMYTFKTFLSIANTVASELIENSLQVKD